MCYKKYLITKYKIISVQNLFRRVRDGAKGERSETFHDVRAKSEQRVNTPPLGAD